MMYIIGETGTVIWRDFAIAVVLTTEDGFFCRFYLVTLKFTTVIISAYRKLSKKIPTFLIYSLKKESYYKLCAIII